MRLSKLLKKLQKFEVPDDVEVFCFDDTNNIYYDPVKVNFDDDGNIKIEIEEI